VGEHERERERGYEGEMRGEERGRKMWVSTRGRKTEGRGEKGKRKKDEGERQKKDSPGVRMDKAEEEDRGEDGKEVGRRC
jgi:hypothetical protein